MEILSSSTKDTKKLAGRIAGNLKPTDVLALYGDLGSGKTTFTKYLVEALGIPSRVQSPTFVLIRKYFGGFGKIKTVYHIDLYRLADSEEVADLGLKEFFDENNSITIIEWPELAEKFLPDNTLKIKFEYITENERKISVQNFN